MYAGNIMEIGETKAVFDEPKHPYTFGLLGSLPSLSSGGELISIPGVVPDAINPPPGCKFHPRCFFAKEICKIKRPSLREIEKGRWSACIRLEELKDELKLGW
jgi:peptide/nickel transport system ATP-binding protein